MGPTSASQVRKGSRLSAVEVGPEARTFPQKKRLIQFSGSALGSRDVVTEP